MHTDVDQWEVGRVEGRGRQKKECNGSVHGRISFWRGAMKFMLVQMM